MNVQVARQDLNQNRATVVFIAVMAQ